MRRVFLWAARDRWLKEHLPGFRSCSARSGGSCRERRSTRRSTRRDRSRRRASAMYTRLGENLTDLAEADEVADHYIAVFEAVAGRGYRGGVRSSRPSSGSISTPSGRSPTSGAWRRGRGHRLVPLDRHGG